MIYLKLRLLLALLVMFVMTILPMPDLITGFRPPWVLLFVVYIQLVVPKYFNLAVLFVIGLFLDVLSTAPLGEHALALVLTTWIVTKKTRRFAFFNLGQQMAYVMFYCLIYQLTISFIDAFLGYHYNLFSAVTSAFIGMLIWPWLRILGDGLFRVKRVVTFL